MLQRPVQKGQRLGPRSPADPTGPAQGGRGATGTSTLPRGAQSRALRSHPGKCPRPGDRGVYRAPLRPRQPPHQGLGLRAGIHRRKAGWHQLAGTRPPQSLQPGGAPHGPRALLWRTAWCSGGLPQALLPAVQPAVLPWDPHLPHPRAPTKDKRP